MALGEHPGIYAIFCKTTGLPYIGSSMNVHYRIWQHATALRRKRHEAKKLTHAWEIYGEDSFVAVILEWCPKEDLFEREQFYIDAWDACNNGYNTNEGPIKSGAKRTPLPPPKEVVVNPDDILLTVEDTANLTKIAAKTIYRLASQGDIPCIRIGRNVRFRREDIENLRTGGKQ